MGYTVGTLEEEIAAKVTYLEEMNGPTLSKQWLINAVISDHADIHGADADFAICCARLTVEARVDRYFRTIKKAEDEGTEQSILPGFEKLQKRYVVERDEEQVIVLIQDMTDEEIDFKANQHRTMGAGHYQHADELERYKRDRHQQALGF